MMYVGDLVVGALAAAQKRGELHLYLLLPGEIGAQERLACRTVAFARKYAQPLLNERVDRRQLFLHEDPHVDDVVERAATACARSDFTLR